MSTAYYPDESGGIARIELQADTPRALAAGAIVYAPDLAQAPAKAAILVARWGGTCIPEAPPKGEPWQLRVDGGRVVVDAKATPPPEPEPVATVSAAKLAALRALAVEGLKADLQAAALAVCDEGGVIAVEAEVLRA